MAPRVPPATPFRKLIDKCRSQNREPGEKPITVQEMAELCNISRPFFYSLLIGAHGARPFIRERLLKGLQPFGVTKKQLDVALDATRLCRSR